MVQLKWKSERVELDDGIMQVLDPDIHSGQNVLQRPVNIIDRLTTAHTLTEMHVHKIRDSTTLWCIASSIALPPLNIQV